MPPVTPIRRTACGSDGAAETTHGNVRVGLGESPSLHLDVRTTGGAITARRPLITSQEGPNALVATMGAGTGDLRIRTTSGAVVIE